VVNEFHQDERERRRLREEGKGGVEGERVFGKGSTHVINIKITSNSFFYKRPFIF
jgi:hypothetical protein